MLEEEFDPYANSAYDANSNAYDFELPDVMDFENDDFVLTPPKGTGEIGKVADYLDDVLNETNKLMGADLR